MGEELWERSSASPAVASGEVRPDLEGKGGELGWSHPTGRAGGSAPGLSHLAWWECTGPGCILGRSPVPISSLAPGSFCTNKRLLQMWLRKEEAASELPTSGGQIQT